MVLSRNIVYSLYYITLSIKSKKYTDNRKKSLDYHRSPRPGKICVEVTKSLASIEDISLAYSPGVAFPCQEIQNDPSKVYDYTSKGNTVAVITNGTAVLGLGNIGALASKPVMEGKEALFRHFGNIHAVDIEIDETDPDLFISHVEAIAPSFGGINLEDIRSPESFYIEKELQKRLSIPVFHDDQHGTAIVTAAGILNALEITEKAIEDINLVLYGLGAAGTAVLSFLLDEFGLKNFVALDSNGVIHKGRDDLLPYKKDFAIETDKRTLEDCMKDADVFIGLFVSNILHEHHILSMAPSPVLFCLANPDPEIMPHIVHRIREDAIVATGRSDFPNQINNVLGFPYIFRAALDMKSKEITKEMMKACTFGLVDLTHRYDPTQSCVKPLGKDYIIPSLFDKRLVSFIPQKIMDNCHSIS